jgi:transcriptional regulator with XRE-family HTH domain
MGSDEAKPFREHLRMLREAKGVSQARLEERIGKEANYITRIETGRIDIPPFEVLARIARELDVSLSDLFFYEGVDDNADVLREKIKLLVGTADLKRLRKYYRLLMVADQE